jgi:CubicO group peptidase (beta-lactamase class C family)
MKHKITILPILLGIVFYLTTCNRQETPVTVVVTEEPAAPRVWPAEQWHTASPEEQGMNPELLSDMLETIDQTSPDIHSMVIIRNGYIILDEFYYDSATASPRRTHTRDEPHSIFSCTKSIVAILIGIAIDEGYIEGILSRAHHRQPG